MLEEEEESDKSTNSESSTDEDREENAPEPRYVIPARTRTQKSFSRIAKGNKEIHRRTPDNTETTKNKKTTGQDAVK